MTQEAAELSSLKPQLEQLQVPLFAVVKEDVGTEVQNFRAYFKGEEIFLDEKVGEKLQVFTMVFLRQSLTVLLLLLLLCCPEVFLWASWAPPGPAGLPAAGRVAQRPEGLQEWLHGECSRGGLHPGGSLRHRSGTAGKKLGSHWSVVRSCPILTNIRYPSIVQLQIFDTDIDHYWLTPIYAVVELAHYAWLALGQHRRLFSASAKIFC